MNAQHTAAELIRGIREEFPADKSIVLNLGGTPIEVRSNHEPLIDDLRDYFSEFLGDEGEGEILITAHEAPEQDMGFDYTVKQPDPGKTKIKEEFVNLEDGRVVRKRLTGMVFVFGHGENMCVGPCLENSNQVINFINNRFIEKQLNLGCLLGHAAAVAVNGRGMAMAGFSGMGKSTLALHCMSRGTDFVSNDRVMVENPPAGESLPTMYGVAKQPRINPGTALNNPDLSTIVSDEDKEKFLSLPLDELWKLEHKYDALIDQCYGPGHFFLRSPMDALVILNWKRDEPETVIQIVDPRERRDLLPAFMKATGLFYLPTREDRETDPGVEEYAELLSKTTLIEISGGVDFDKAADACVSFLKTGDIQG